MPEAKKGSVPLMENPPVPPTRAGAKTYPTPPDAEGFFFRSEQEEIAGIQTRVYDNGAEVKKVTLSNGSKAVIRKLKGRDFLEAKKRVQNDNSLDVDTVGLSNATLVDGEAKPVEFYLDDLYQADYVNLFLAYGELNL